MAGTPACAPDRYCPACEPVARLPGMVRGNDPPKAGAATYRFIPINRQLCYYMQPRKKMQAIFCNLYIFFCRMQDQSARNTTWILHSLTGTRSAFPGVSFLSNHCRDRMDHLLLSAASCAGDRITVPPPRWTRRTRGRKKRRPGGWPGRAHI